MFFREAFAHVEDEIPVVVAEASVLAAFVYSIGFNTPTLWVGFKTIDAIAILVV
jgi:hypothetical protein